MRWSVCLILGLCLAFGASVSRGEWRMQIYKGGTAEEHVLAEIDSLTFCEVVAPSIMVWVPPGYVRMGQAGIAEPVHDFYVEGFWIDAREVSNARFKRFIDAGGYQNAALWNPVGWSWRVAENITLPAFWNDASSHGGGILGNEDFPVTGVSWWEADAYCRWSRGRLPTEPEWERAAKGGCETHGDPEQCDELDTPSYPWGEGISGPQANYVNSGDPYDNNTTPVGYYDGRPHGAYQTQDSPSPYGSYDVAGNIDEWCSTKEAPYPYNPNDGRENPPATWDECCRILRGGSWGTVADFLRCARRIGGVPSDRPSVGFRCVRTH